MPPELVFGEQEPAVHYEEVEYAGTKLIMERLSSTQGRVVRIISSDPADFLNPSYQPGTTFNYSLVSPAPS